MTSRLAYAVSGEISTLLIQIEKEEYNSQSMQVLFDVYEANLGMIITFDHGGFLESPEPTGELYYSWEGMIKKALDKQLGEILESYYTVNVDFEEKWVEVRTQTQKGILNVSLPQKRLFSSTTYIFLLWVFFVSILFLIIAVLFMRNQIRPIRRLATAAERFGKGIEKHRFKVEGAKEVRQAGNAFLEMKERIRRQVSQRTDMLAGVSHDLRTPITRLKLQIAMLGDGPDIYEMKRDIDDMERMIDGYLNFVRGEGKEETTDVDIAGLINEIATDTKRQGISIDIKLNDIKAVIPIRKTALKRSLMNILGNAKKHANHIWIDLSLKEDNKLRIVIEDDGIGIEEDQMDDVFKPFYRVDISRNAETGGIGLGLPIAKDIVNAHGGEIFLQKSRYGGLAVVITLPT